MSNKAISSAPEIDRAAAQLRQAVSRYKTATLNESIGYEKTVNYFPFAKRLLNRTELERKQKFIV